MRSVTRASADSYQDLCRELGIRPTSAWRYRDWVALGVDHPAPSEAIYTDLRVPDSTEPDVPTRKAKIELLHQEGRIGALVTLAATQAHAQPGLNRVERHLYDAAKKPPEQRLHNAHLSIRHLAYLAVVSADEGAGIIPLSVAEGYIGSPVGGLADAELMIHSAVQRVKGQEPAITAGWALPLALRYLFPEPDPFTGDYPEV